MNDRIKLAEAMGWKWDKSTRPRAFEGYPNWCCWIRPSGGEFRFSPEDMPDPFTDANDCETLITHLNEQGWQVEVHWQHCNDEQLAAGAYIHIWNRDSEIHERTDIDVDRWKEGVCKLALKVLS